MRPRRARLRWSLWGAAALIVAAGSAGTGLALTSSPASRPPLSHAAPAVHTTPSHTVTPTARNTPSAAKRTAHPSRTASHPTPPPPAQTPAQAPAQAQAQPTTVPQQDCYAPPHPTCVPPPPPSSLLDSPYIPNPTNPTPRPSYTISETP